MEDIAKMLDPHEEIPLAHKLLKGVLATAAGAIASHFVAKGVQKGLDTYTNTQTTV